MMIANEKTGLQVTLKSKEKLEMNDILAAFNLVSRNGKDEVMTLPGDDLKKVYDEMGNAVKDELKVFEGCYNGEPETEKVMEIKSRPRTIEKIGSGRTLTNSIGDLLADRQNSKVYVNCPVCSFEGDSNTWQGNYYSKCPCCESKLFNSWATGSPNEVDEDGYEYFATSEYKTRK